MHGRLIITLAPLLLAAGCSSGEETQAADENTGDTAAEKSGQSFPEITPGQWTMTIEILESKLEGTLPGMPANAAEGFAAMKGRTDTTTKCMTPEIAKDFSALVNPEADAGKCALDEMDNDGDRVNISMTCQKPVVPGGPLGTEKRKTTGEVTADKIDIINDSTLAVNGIKMISSMRMSGTRTGDCPPA